MIDKNDPRLTAYVLGELEASETAEIKQAVESNPELQKAVEEIQDTVGLLGSAFASEEKVSLADDQKQALEAAAVGEFPVGDPNTKTTLSDKSASRNGLFYLTLAIAAALVLMLIPLSGYFNTGNPFARMEQASSYTADKLETTEIPEAKEPSEKSDDAKESKREGVEELDLEVDAFADELKSAESVEFESDPMASGENLASGERLAKGGAGFGGGGGGRGGGGFRSRGRAFGESTPTADSPADARAMVLDRDAEEEASDGLGTEALAQHDRMLESRQQGNIRLDLDNIPRTVNAAPFQQPRNELHYSELREEEPQDFFEAANSDESFPAESAPQLNDSLEAIQSPARMRGSNGRANHYANGRASHNANGQLAEGEDRGSSIGAAGGEGGANMIGDGRLDSYERASDQAAASSSRGTSRGDNIGAGGSMLDDSEQEMSKIQPGTDLRQQGQGQQAQQFGGQGQQADGQQQAQRPTSRFAPQKNEGIANSKFGLVEQEKLGRILALEIGKQVDPSFENEIQLRNANGVDAFYIKGQDQPIDEGKLLNAFVKNQSAATGDDDLLPNLLKRVNPSGTGEITIDKLPEQVRLAFGKGLATRNAEVRRKNKTWKKVRATPNTTRLMVGDKDELELNGMQVNVQIDGFRARVLLDYFYYNHFQRQLEGTFKLRLPDDASLYYFAFGQSVYAYQGPGKLAQGEFQSRNERFVSLQPASISRARQNDWQHVKEARMVPKEKAAHAYRETVRRRVDPALVEWSGAGVFNARVFPLLPNKLHRIVIGYDVNLTETDDGYVFDLPLPANSGDCKINLNVLEMEGSEISVTPKIEAEENMKRVMRLTEKQANEIRKLTQQRQELLVRFGKTHPKVLEIDAKIDAVSDDRNEALLAKGAEKTLESQFHFDNPDAESIRLTLKNSKSLLLRSDSKEEGSFWATRITPDLPKVAAEGSDRAVFLVDTSLSSQPDKFNVWLKLLESTLKNNRDSLKQFAVVFFNVGSEYWQEKYVPNDEANVKKLLNDCQQLALEGATDLYGALDLVAQSDWIKSDKNAPDMFLLSDGAANWGETNLRLMNRLVADNNLGSLFAYQTGMNGTAIANLRFITSESGGAVFSVASEDEVQRASMAHRNRPWKLESITADGASDVMTAGRAQWVYPGQSLTIVGRVEASDKEGERVEVSQIKLNLRQSGDDKSIDIIPNQFVTTDLASRLYGQVAVGQLESLGDEVFDVSTAYARHFRVTGQTCSLLMLESEADYQRFGIKPEEDLFVIKSKNVDRLIQKTLDTKSTELADPKQQLLTWLARLESMPGLNFKMPTALKLAIDDMNVVAISDPLDCSARLKSELPESYQKLLSQENLDYKKIKKELKRRLKDQDADGSTTAEGLKVMSNLIERKPGDIVLARDVAFTAMELGKPAQAYYLLRRVAKARPFEPSNYLALGQCLSQLGQADMAMIFYEVAMTSQFSSRGQDYRKIVATEYSHLLREVLADKTESGVKEFAKARLKSISDKMNIQPCDLVVTMMWNTDQTDIDLHIIEPSGEECYYQHRDTKSGAHLTQDITNGFGPEMYKLNNAPKGDYRVLVKYYAGNQNRTDLRSKVYLTVHRNFGRENATVTRKAIELSEVGGKEPVDTVSVK